MSPATAIPPAPNSREYFSSVNVLVFALGNRGGEDLWNTGRGFSAARRCSGNSHLFLPSRKATQ